MPVRRSLVLLGIVMLLAPIVAFSTQANQIQSARPDRNLQFYTVGTGTVDVVVNAIGNIRAEAEAGLSFPQPGQIAEVLVQPDQVVAAGTVLARLASENEQIALERAQLALTLAQLEKDDLMQPLDEGDLAIAQANLDSAWGAYLGIQNSISTEDVQRAQLRYEQAQAAEQAALDERQRLGFGLPDEQYQLLDAQVGQASFDAEIARLQLEALQNANQGQLGAAYARVIQAQRDLERTQAGPTQTQFDQADLAIAQAQADVDQAQQALDQMAIIAPFDGVVSQVNIEVGELGSAAFAAIRLADVTPLRLTVQVDEIDIRSIREGMTAVVTLDALPGVALRALIERIALVGSNDNGIISYDVEVRLDESDARVRVGMTAEASVVVAQQVDVLVVPNEYIRLDRDQGKAFVNIVNADGQLQEIEVTLGLQGEDNSEIVTGLEAGDVLAVDLGGDRFAILGG
ncbi:MAG: efflux RND transporter periplasmic adaptor subunit [Anaerolineae bacterium]|nr:efflux RND transporter periplasmic adaptor subunit [Anaerolineae bacterium]